MKGARQAAKGAARALSPRRKSRDETFESTFGSQPDHLTAVSPGRRRRTRTARKASQAGHDLPDLELTEEEFLKEWGITKDQEVRRRKTCGGFVGVLVCLLIGPIAIPE